MDNAVGYARVSTDEQDVQNQVDHLKKAGVNVIFADEGVSGMKPPLQRPDYKRMIDYIKTHPVINTVVVFEISRLDRNFQSSINTFLNLEKENVRVISLTESWTRDIQDGTRNLILSIMSWINEEELKRISVRTKIGMDKVRKYGSKSGKPIGKPRKELNEEVVMKLHNEGHKWARIARDFRVSPSTVYKYRQQWKAARLGRGNDKQYN